MAEESRETHESPFQRLQRELGEMIANAHPGEKFPTEPDLARQMKVSRSTLREAMRSFETQGLLLRKQGSGTFKADTSSVFDSGLEVLESLETQAGRLGLGISMGNLELEPLLASGQWEGIVKYFGSRGKRRKTATQPRAHLRHCTQRIRNG